MTPFTYKSAYESGLSMGCARRSIIFWNPNPAGVEPFNYPINPPLCGLSSLVLPRRIPNALHNTCLYVTAGLKPIASRANTLTPGSCCCVEACKIISKSIRSRPVLLKHFGHQILLAERSRAVSPEYSMGYQGISLSSEILSFYTPAWVTCNTLRDSMINQGNQDASL